MKLVKLSSVTFAVLASLGLATAAVAADNPGRLKPAIAPSVQSFALGDVKLLSSPFKHAMDLDMKYLLSVETDRLLAGFRETAGLTPKAQAYGGWEGGTLAGHSLGHYLTACCLVYSATGDTRFLERVNYIVDELAEVQKTNGNGYVAAIPNGQKIFADVAAGNIVSRGFDLNGLWAPWYNMHKAFIGLIDAYQLCDNQKALEVAKGFGDWTISITSKLNDEQWQKMLACEYGGMNEPLAQLYWITGEKKYHDIARKFYDKVVLDPLAERKDSLPGKHSNTQIPKIIGIARLYELTGSETDKTISQFFWDTVVNHHTYAIGGNSEGEYFGPANRLADRISENTAETCNTYNMLKLTEHLYKWNPEVRYVDYYERALYNHILASQDPVAGGVTYFVPLKSGSSKRYSRPFDDFTCCHGTGMENHVKYGGNIYYHDDSSLYVNLFIPSELNWAAKGVKVRQDTRFPESDAIRLTFTCERPAQFTVKFRYPSWAVSGFKASVNGKSVAVTAKPGSYVEFAREWNSGDRLDVQVPMKLHIEPTPDRASRAAILKGPIVMAGNLGSDREPAPKEIPVILTDHAHSCEWCKHADVKPFGYQTDGVGKPMDVTLTPFYATHHSRYVVYWDFFTQQDWKIREAQVRAEEARMRELESRTADFIQLGEMQPERDHNFLGDRTTVGETDGRKYRTARESWFSFEMKVPAEGAAEMICTYWGGERYRPNFDILVDDQKIATVQLANDMPGKFKQVTYQIPDSVIAGKSKVTVKFQAAEGSNVGRVFDCRIVKRK